MAGSGYGRLVSALLFAFGLILLGVATLMLWFADPIARVMAGRIRPVQSRPA